MVTERLSRILLVEDEVDLQRVVQLTLATLGGFEVRASGSCDEALAVTRDFTPQLFLLDVMLPVVDGLQTLAELRRRPDLSATPAIFLTARAHPDEIAVYRRAGALGVLVKPFDPLTLCDRLREIWEGRSTAGGGG